MPLVATPRPPFLDPPSTGSPFLSISLSSPLPSPLSPSPSLLPLPPLEPPSPHPHPPIRNSLSSVYPEPTVSPPTFRPLLLLIVEAALVAQHRLVVLLQRERWSGCSVAIGAIVL